MNTLTASNQTSLSLPEMATPSARYVFKLLQKLKHGSLTIRLPDGSAHTVGDGNGPHVSMQMHNWNPFSAALKSGDIGFAESYLNGDWTTSQLPALMGLFIANRNALDQVIHGNWAGRLLYRIRHLLNRNTKSNSRKNIHAHYDLGNAFYSSWLDGTMNYSSAIFNGDLEQDFEQAQHAKVRRALNMVNAREGNRVLEIGCGWGALAEKATKEFNSHITGVTLSTEQLSWAKERLAAQGLADKADLRLQDYRDINDGPYDAICSIEMIEAVGQEYWPTYFETISRLLKPSGRACIQSIVIRDDLFDRYIRSTDFIQQYIFPGGCLPSPSSFKREAGKAGLKIIDEYCFGRDYAETCRRWRNDFLAKRDNVLSLGFDERFIRIWDFYLAYCEAGFEAGDIDVVQYTLER